MMRRFRSVARFSAVLGCLAIVALGPVSGCSASSSEEDESADAVTAIATDPVTLKNWSKHPRVVEIRQMVEGVESNLSSNVYKLEKKDKLCTDSGETIREKVTEPSGTIRKLGLRSGSDDGAAVEAFYYLNGVVRFVFREHRVGSSVVREDRIYFDETGKRFFWGVRGDWSQGDKATKVDALPYRLGTVADEEDFALTADLKQNPQARYDAKPSCD